MPSSHASKRHDRGRLISVALPVAAALGLAIALLVAFASSETSTVPAAGPTGEDAPAAGTFTARTIAGEEVEVPGSRPSILFFFSISCGTCGPGAQALAEAQRDIGDQANFVVIDVVPEESDGDIQDFLTYFEADRLAYTSDVDARLITTYQVTQLSTAIVLDSAGNEVSRTVDPSPADIRAELAKAGSA